MNRPSAFALPLLLFAPLLATAALAADTPDEFKVRREAVFKFAQKPTVTREGDKVSVSFETKGFCDVTVAIEPS